jgi:hypothetical protein
VVRFRVELDALAQQVQFAFAAFQDPLTLGQLLRMTADRVVEALHLLGQAGTLKVCTELFDLVAPRRRVATGHRAALRAFSQTRGFAEVHFLPQAGARVARCIADERPANRFVAGAVVVQMLLRGVGVVPDDTHLKTTCLVTLQANDLDARDAFERVEDGAFAQPFDRIRPLGSLAHVDGVVVAVRVAEAQHHPPRDVTAERVDQLLFHEPHRGGTQDDDTLIVKADDAEVWPEVQQLGQLEAVDGLGGH